MNKYHISLELPKILLTLSEMTSCEEARLAALSLQPSGDFFEVQKLPFRNLRLLIYS